MPKAVASMDTERFELKSLPGAFIVLRRMTYGQLLQRRDMVKLSLEMNKGKDVVGEMAMANKKVSQLEFQWCIIEHNLEKDDMGTLLSFANEADFASLDPKVGSEIDKLINDMNNYEETDDSKN